MVFVENSVVARIDAVTLCSDQQSQLKCNVNRNGLELWTPLRKGVIYSKDLQGQLAVLDKAMKGTVATYLGGLPGISLPFSSVLKTCFKSNVFGFVLFVCLYWDRVSLHRSGCSGIHYVYRPVWPWAKRSTYPCLLAACTIMPGQIDSILNIEF